MSIRRIHVESVFADEHEPDAGLTELERLQEHEEQRQLRAVTARRRRPLLTDRPRAD